MTSEYLLVFQGGTRDGESIPLEPGTLTIGRTKACDLAIDDVTVSGRHATLTCAPDGTFVLTDLGSTNGTFVHSERCTTPVTLEAGDSFRLGKVNLRVVSQGQVEEKAARSERSRERSERRARRDEKEGLSEQTKALLIGLLGGAIVLALAFYVLDPGRADRRMTAVDEDEDVAVTGPLLGEDRGFELDEKARSGSWDVVPGSSARTRRATSGAFRGERALELPLPRSLGERYLPSIGVQFSSARLPGLRGDQVLAIQAVGQASGGADGALWHRVVVDDDGLAPTTILRGALLSTGEDAGDGWRRVTTRVVPGEGDSGEASYDFGLLGFSSGGGLVRFDEVEAEREERARDPWTFQLDPSGRMAFHWAGTGSALVARWAHRGKTTRLGFLRAFSFVPSDSARPLWMDPSYAALIARGPQGELALPSGGRIAWKTEVVTREERGQVHLVLDLLDASGPFPPLAFHMPAVLLAGSEAEAARLFGGDELVANWVLNEEAAARLGGEAYPTMAEGELDGVLGIAFGPYDLRSFLKLSHAAHASVRAVRTGYDVVLHPAAGEATHLEVVLGPVDAPDDAAFRSERRKAQDAARAGAMGQATEAYRAILDRALLIANPGSRKARPNVRAEIERYAAVERELRVAIAAAVKEFEQVERRVQQAIALGATSTLRALLREFGDETSPGLLQRHAGSPFESAMVALRDRILGTLAADEDDPLSPAGLRRQYRESLVRQIEARREAIGREGASALLDALRSTF